MRRILVVAALVVGAVALADKTVTFLTAPARVASMRFHLSYFPDAGVDKVTAVVCGQTRTGSATGPFSDGSCYDADLPPGNAIRTSVTGLASGQARTFWLAQEAL